jgi:3-methyladenine DNA glycosylase AlkD
MEEMKKVADPGRAASSAAFFKTGRGQYGEGDRFLGITVPENRRLVRKFRGSGIEVYRKLLASPFHEVRLFALLSLGDAFTRADEKERENIFRLYIASTGRVNNWDLVDSSAPHIPGRWLENRDRGVLYHLSRSELLWDRRIAIIATLHFIRKNDFVDTLSIADILLEDREDLIHKAVGWMLREVGKRDRETEERFLKERYGRMPRTMLRYAIEKFEPEVRMKYLKGLF